MTLILACSVVEVFARAIIDPADLMALTGQKLTRQYAFNMLDDAYSAYTWPRNMTWRPRTLVPRGGQKTTNSHGFVSTPELEREKPPGTTRLVFLGGSSTIDARLADTHTWVWRTVDRLRERFPEKKIDFINGGHTGYGTFESYGRLWSRLRFFFPDIIVVYHAWNDFQYFMEEDMSLWRVPPDGTSWTVARHVRAKVYEPLSVDPIVRYSRALTAIRLALSEPISDEAVRIPTVPKHGVRVPATPEESLRDRIRNLKDYRHENLEVFRANIQLMRAVASIVDAELFVAKQATMVTPFTDKRLRRGFNVGWRHGFDYDAHVRAFADIYRVIDEEIAPDHVIDATPLSGHRQYFRDHLHLRMAGAEALSEIMAETLGAYFARAEEL